MEEKVEEKEKEKVEKEGKDDKVRMKKMMEKYIEIKEENVD